MSRLSVPVAAGLDQWLLLLHILAAMVWFGGSVVLSALVTGVLRRGEPDAIARFVAALRTIGPIVFAPAPGIVLVTGIWQVAHGGAWDFGQSWVQLALALFAAAFLIGVAHQSRAAIGAERAVAAGELDEAARRIGRWAWGSRVILVLLAAAVWDMVFKPGL